MANVLVKETGHIRRAHMERIGNPDQFHSVSTGCATRMSESGVRRDKAALSSGCKSHPATAPAGSNRSSYGGDEIAEAFGMRVTNW